LHKTRKQYGEKGDWSHNPEEGRNVLKAVELVSARLGLGNRFLLEAASHTPGKFSVAYSFLRVQG